MWYLCAIIRHRCESGNAAYFTKSRERLKYRDLLQNCFFIAFDVENSETLHTETRSFIRELGERVFLKCGDSKSWMFTIKNRIAIQRGNVAGILGTRSIQTFLFLDLGLIWIRLYIWSCNLFFLYLLLVIFKLYIT